MPHRTQILERVHPRGHRCSRVTAPTPGEPDDPLLTIASLSRRDATAVLLARHVQRRRRRAARARGPARRGQPADRAGRRSSLPVPRRRDRGPRAGRLARPGEGRPRLRPGARHRLPELRRTDDPRRGTPLLPRPRLDRPPAAHRAAGPVPDHRDGVRSVPGARTAPRPTEIAERLDLDLDLRRRGAGRERLLLAHLSGRHAWSVPRTASASGSARTTRRSTAPRRGSRCSRCSPTSTGASGSCSRCGSSRGPTQSEIGEVLGITQMQVSRLLSALLARLRDELGTVT